MTDTPQARPAETYAEVEDALLSRWPETRLDPSLSRIGAFTELLGDPQRGYPVVHLTGTNGKTSTARMIETLLRVLELRTGRFTSPHLEKMSERIVVDGEPLSDDDFVAAFNDVAPYTHLVDADQEHPLSFFETVVGMAFAKFAEAPVDVAVVEVGMGGAWDATNVADGAVAVVLPIAVDHASYLGEAPADIAAEKAGIIKAGATGVLAEQDDAVLAVLLDRAAEVGATVVREGVDFGVTARTPAVGGQVVTVQSIHRTYDDLLLPLYGAHQAQNAAVALAAVESLLDREIDEDVVREAFERFTSPGRLEIVRRSPAIILDAAHNPHGAQATAAALEDSFTFDPLVGVIGVMADKDYEGVLEAFEPHLAHVVVTRNSSDRAMSAERLGQVAVGIFGEDRVTVVPRLADALTRAVDIAEQQGGGSISTGAVLVTGSVITAGEARALLGPPASGRRRTPLPSALVATVESSLEADEDES